MESLNEKSGFYAVILFIIWPFLALASAFRNYTAGWGKNILWAFVAFYGFVFAIGLENQNSDIVRYVAEIEMLSSQQMTVSSAFNYFVEKGEIDIIDTVISVILSRFTANQSVVTLVYGFIFGFFFSRNMWYVLENFEGKIKPITILLFASFFLIVPIWEMNGFRFWTAVHVYIYGVLPFLFEGKRGKLLVAMSSPLFHFAFLVPVAILMGYLLLGNRLVIYFAFFATTFFVSEIDISVMNNLIESYAPEIIQERSSSYRGENQVSAFREQNQETRVWYVVWYSRLLKWSIMGFLVVLFFRGRTFFEKNKRWLNLFCFTLLFYSIANLFSSIPSGGRYLSIANLLALAIITLYIQNRDQEIVMERFVWAATPALLLYIIVAFRIGLYSMSATSIIGNPITAIFLMGENISLNDMIKMLL